MGGYLWNKCGVIFEPLLVGSFRALSWPRSLKVGFLMDFSSLEVKKKISPHVPLKNAGKLCETRKSKMAAVAILKKWLFIKSFKTDIFFIFLGSGNTNLALFLQFGVKFALKCQIKVTIFIFYLKFGIF